MMFSKLQASEIEWFYKSVGHERNWQFKVFPAGTVKEKPNSVIAKVWNWDKKWQVKRYEDGAAKGAMQRFNGYDPDYLDICRPIEDREIYPTPGIFLLF